MMGSVIARCVVAAALLAVAAVCWSEAALSYRLADAHERIATLQHAAELPLEGRLTTAAWLEALPGSLAAETRSHEVRAAYWLTRYDALTTGTVPHARDDDQELLVMAANAAFRASQRVVPNDRSESKRGAPAQHLESVLQAYATALESGGFNADAAYNYEYVARLRDTLAKGKVAPPDKTRPTGGPAPARAAGDLPAGATIHGRPGQTPPPTRGEQFEIITPMEFGEREAQPEQTPGGKVPRKG